jgi:hypothetical protein
LNVPIFDEELAGTITTFPSGSRTAPAYEPPGATTFANVSALGLYTPMFEELKGMKTTLPEGVRIAPE